MEAKIVEKQVEAYIRQLLPEREAFFTALEQTAADEFIPIVQPEVAQLLRLLIAMHKPARVLEIGAAIGYSASLMALAMGTGEVDTIELNEPMAMRAQDTFDRLGLELSQHADIHLFIGDAKEVIAKRQAGYDMVFIDAAKSHYKAYLDLVMPLVREGGLIISDNVLYKGTVADDALVPKKHKTIVKRMRDYLAYISAHPALTTSVLSVGDGVALSYIKEN
jgi:predicted O-methyltransferase YrrM